MKSELLIFEKYIPVKYNYKDYNFKWCKHINYNDLETWFKFIYMKLIDLNLVDRNKYDIENISFTDLYYKTNFNEKLKEGKNIKVFGTCRYFENGYIQLLINTQDHKHLNSLINTMCHEFSHIFYNNHGINHKAMTKRLCDYIKSCIIEIL